MTAPNSSPSSLRWNDYVLAQDSDDAIEAVWRAAGSGKTSVYVLAEGFDPRTLVGLRRFLPAVGAAKVTVLSLGMPETADVVAKTFAAENVAERDALAAKHGATVIRVPYPSVSEPRAAGKRIAHSIILDGHLKGAAHIVIDVSAMPTVVHFALIGAVLAHCESEHLNQDLQVVVCDNPELDAAIVNLGTATADPVPGFTHGLDSEAGSKQVRIWAPVLGHGESAALRAVRDRLEAREICPVLPFPAVNPRRGDDLLSSYRQLLIEETEIDLRDIIYADERNPFDLYRTLSRLHARYSVTLAAIGDVKVIFSAHSSKLLSLGVLLAAYEHKLPVVSAPPTGYALSDGFDREALEKHHRLVCLWLEGSPYR